MHTTWILVANKARAMLLTTTSSRDRLTVVEEIDHPEGRMHESEMKSDRPGQSFDSRGVARHAMQPNESPSKHETRVFARTLASLLEAAADMGKFDQLILVCAPELLGELRGVMHAPVSARVVGEVAKDIAKWSEPEIIAAARKIVDERTAPSVSH